MDKIKIAIIGYGNIGKFAKDAVQSSKDMELVGVVRQNTKDNKELLDTKVVNDIKDLGKVDVAILSIPSRNVKERTIQYLNMGINTVDCFDIHNLINDFRDDANKVAIKNNKACIIASGWDPGSDSIIRALLEAAAPRGITYTNFGPGMSMGHSVVAKSKEGVKDALSMTIPLGTSIHRRVVYVSLKEDANFDNIKKEILQDEYFKHDETIVIQVDDVNDLIDKGHGVNIIRKGVSGCTDNQLFEFNMKINNPALTAQMMVSSARAVLKQKPGAYTLIEVPIIDFLYGDKRDLIKRLV